MSHTCSMSFSFHVIEDHDTESERGSQHTEPCVEITIHGVSEDRDTQSLV